jgi:hypothetical protein
MMVMMMAITPSLNASIRFLVIFPSYENTGAQGHSEARESGCDHKHPSTARQDALQARRLLRRHMRDGNSEGERRKDYGLTKTAVPLV